MNSQLTVKPLSFSLCKIENTNKGLKRNKQFLICHTYRSLRGLGAQMPRNFLLFDGRKPTILDALRKLNEISVITVCLFLNVLQVCVTLLRLRCTCCFHSKESHSIVLSTSSNIVTPSFSMQVQQEEKAAIFWSTELLNAVPFVKGFLCWF